MSIAAKNLIEAQFAPNTDMILYTATKVTTIIDKFTATNTDSGTQTITVNIVPSGGSVGSQNIVTSAFSLTAGTSAALPEQQNQILNPGDMISVKASVASKVVVRANGREISS